jgi:hypothetical protein
LLYKTTGNPCSCANCSPGKIQEKPNTDFNKFNKMSFDTLAAKSRNGWKNSAWVSKT